MIRVQLPAPLRVIAKVHTELAFDIPGTVTQRKLLDALELQLPVLRGTIRDSTTQLRRPFLRFHACDRDLSHESPDAPLPDRVVSGDEPYLIIGGLAGG